MCKRKARKLLYKNAVLYNAGLISSIDFKNSISQYIIEITEHDIYKQLNDCILRMDEENQYAR